MRAGPLGITGDEPVYHTVLHSPTKILSFFFFYFEILSLLSVAVLYWALHISLPLR